VTTSVASGVPSLSDPEVGSRLSRVTLNESSQPELLAGSTSAGEAVKMISFVALPPPGTLEVQVTPAQVVVMLESPT
jgi:hypothetical protein